MQKKKKKIVVTVFLSEKKRVETTMILKINKQSKQLRDLKAKRKPSRIKRRLRVQEASVM